MLSAEFVFATFSPCTICDTSKFLEALNCLTCSSWDEVDDLVRKAVQAGGTTAEPAEDLGFMYQHSFLDPDGHAQPRRLERTSRNCERSIHSSTVAALTHFRSPFTIHHNHLSPSLRLWYVKIFRHKTQMIAYQVNLNGKPVATAGLAQGVVSAIANWTFIPSDVATDWHASFALGGLDHSTREHLHWYRTDLKVGDEITLKLVEVDAADIPTEPLFNKPTEEIKRILTEEFHQSQQAEQAHL